MLLFVVFLKFVILLDVIKWDLLFVSMGDDVRKRGRSKCLIIR